MQSPASAWVAATNINKQPIRANAPLAKFFMNASLLFNDHSQTHDLRHNERVPEGEPATPSVNESWPFSRALSVLRILSPISATIYEWGAP
jgi:hypothetical protein